MLQGRRRGRAGWLTLAGACLASNLTATAEARVAVAAAPPAYPPGIANPAPGGVTADALVRMDSSELDRLYRGANPGIQPRGRVRGVPIVSPGSPIAPTLSRGARIVWQGKVFRDDGRTAVNRFFGVQAVRGNLYYGTSWVDGRPSLVLDYQRTSLVYRRYRDEIRQVGPNLYLGVMHTRTEPVPTFTRYFAFETGR